ncbi:MAG: Fe-S cluster assembly protein SufD [Ignavibacteria bacterium]|nr:Fe-S cluster assembly protein SufD [Ignavibacteria bacterium]
MENIKSKDWYLTNFKTIEGSINGESKTPFHELRRKAIEKFEEIDFPTAKDEDWKYTSISEILKYKFESAETIKVSKEEINKHLIPGLKVNLVVVINGNFSKELSHIHKQADGVRIDSFKNLRKSDPDLIMEHFGKHAQIDNGFVALNTAFANDGIVISVPDNAAIEDYVHILNLTGNGTSNVLSQPRNLVIIGKNSAVKVIESYHSISDTESLVNVVNEVSLGENSHFGLHKLQKECNRSFHINRTQAHQSKGSEFTHFSITLGGSIVRNDTNIVLDGENCTGNLFGLYLTEGTQHVDNHTLIDHAKPHCRSNEMYKGVLNDKSRGVFNGKVFVREDAQKTNAYQSNKAILLTADCKVDTKPQLEIYADDVKCSHGAAIGQLDEEAVFYLRSRGIGEELARKVLIRAFANDIFETLTSAELHDHLNHLVYDKLK